MSVGRILSSVSDPPRLSPLDPHGPSKAPGGVYTDRPWCTISVHDAVNNVSKERREIREEQVSGADSTAGMKGRLATGKTGTVGTTVGNRPITCAEAGLPPSSKTETCF